MRKLLVILFLLISIFGFSQRRDIGVWTSVSVEGKVANKKLLLGGSLNMRLDRNSSMIASYFPEVYLEYKFWKMFTLGAEYRLNIKRASFGGFVPKHRAAAYFILKKDIAPLQASVRVKYQYGWDARKRTSFFQPIASHAMRVKVKISYINWKLIKPYIGNEFTYDFGHHDLGKRFNLYRLSAGLNFNLPKRHEIKLKYIYNLEINVVNPWREHIASVGYLYTFKSKKKKKSKK